ncbi:MAG: single-stranded-DNA-specific exonuclease RecJ [Clostridia bacterium]|nr:single-stranded-DNA-specific exonuclease RecJ [Clostridia bacterium]
MRIRSAIPRGNLQDNRILGLAEALSLPIPLAALLEHRGFRTKEALECFLHPGAKSLHDPFLMKDMKEGAQRILCGVHEGETILIYGDYDADGVTSTATMKRYLLGLGAKVLTYIPNRLEDGYGLNFAVLDTLKDQGIDLMITVDTGSTAAEEIAYAANLGIDTVVIDHHECHSTLPCCCAVINPMRSDCTYPFKGLAGVGVVFKVICAIEQLRHPEMTGLDAAGAVLDSFADAIALGTVADVMPVTDENRYIISRGIEKLNKRPLAGLCALLAQCFEGKKNKTVTSTVIGYTLAPRINAAGRMGSADRALELLLADDQSEARYLAQMLCDFNEARRSEEERISEAVDAMIAEGGYEKDPILVLAAQGWHHGVVGIVAARITERYQKPCVLISVENGIGKGSGRSVEGINLVELLVEAGEYLEKYGGHELAAGLTVKEEQIPLLREKLIDAVKMLPERDAGQEMMVDLILQAVDLTLPLAQSLSLLEPCGNENQTPLFALQGAEICDVTALSGGKYTKLLVKKDGLYFSALLFSKETALFPYGEGDRVDLVFQLSVNEFRNKKSVQLLVKAYFPAEHTALVLEQEQGFFEQALEGKALVTAHLPCREDFAKVYTALRRMAGAGYNSFVLAKLSGELQMPAVKCRLVLAVLEEQGLVCMSMEKEASPIYHFELIPNAVKVDLDQSPMLQKMRMTARS